MDNNQFLQAVLPAAKSGLIIFAARLLALPAFLASAVGAKSLVWSVLKQFWLPGEQLVKTVYCPFSH